MQSLVTFKETVAQPIPELVNVSELRDYLKMTK
jgi:hypothetical protein